MIRDSPPAEIRGGTGTAVTYRCDTGLRLSHNGQTELSYECLSSGYFENKTDLPDPFCEPATGCPVPDASKNLDWTLNEDNDYTGAILDGMTIKY